MSSESIVNYEVRHPEFEDAEYEWRQMRDTVAGSPAVKRSNSLYLPIPAAMEMANAKRSSQSSLNSSNSAADKYLITNAPWQHPNRFYSDYLHRARFPDITSLTLRALLGIATRKSPVIELPTSLEYLRKRATPSGLSLNGLFQHIIAELLTVGRFSLLVDVRSNGEFSFVPYSAESFTNWKTETEDCEEYLKLAVLREVGDADDEFSHSTDYNNYLVLRLEEDDNGVIAYSSTRYSDGKAVEGESVFPAHQGRRSQDIPLFTANATSNGFKVGMSPMIGISDVAISIYQKDADMSQSEYMTCNPWLVFIGIDADDAPKAVGSSLAFVIENSDGDAKYVEPTGSSLAHMQSRINDLFEEGLKYGVALLSSGGAGEAAETVEMRQESQGATLRTIVKNAESIIKNAIQFAIDWTGKNEEFRFEANTKFSEHKLQPGELKSLLEALIEGSISYQTYFENLKRGGVIADDKDIETEMSDIKNKMPLISDDLDG